MPRKPTAATFRHTRARAHRLPPSQDLPAGLSSGDVFEGSDSFCSWLPAARVDVRSHVGDQGLSGLSSPTGRPGRPDPYRIERPARRHKQAAPTITAEADIGATLRQVDAPDGRPDLIEDHDAIEPIAS